MRLELAGGIAAIFWSALRWTVLLVFIATHPSFDVVHKTASEFGRQGADGAWIFNLLNFYLGGLLLLVFALGLGHALSPKRSGAIATALLIVAALGIALPGYFSLPSRFHVPIAVAFFLASPTAALFASYALGAGNRSMRLFSWVVAILWLAITVVGISLQSRGLPPGLYQRVVEVASTLWFLVLGLWLTRRAMSLSRTRGVAGVS
ncbi:MAG TPA: DUF998 domain-containing protein [Candidatus Angelobacter sp.]|nr:DUF998 domain-containing protein [Candidatus Angelobacter sp.]